MKVDATLGDVSLSRVGELSEAAEQIGFDGLWFPEITGNPYSSVAIALDATQTIDVGSALVLAFPRSPMVTAYSSWNLQANFDSRFSLGLGTQVRAHIERRFDVDWHSPVPWFRDYVQALQAIWDAWESDSSLSYDGEFYSFDLCPPKFRPDAPVDRPVPIFLGGVNELNIRLAGAIADGLHLHTFHSPKYVESEVLPAVTSGAERTGRDPDEVTIVASVFAIPGETPAERAENRDSVREEIAFYGSTPSYRTVLEAHGWGDVGERLHELSREDQWEEMSTLITDEMLEAFAVEGSWSSLRDRLEGRYEHVDRVWLYRPFRGEDHWRSFVDGDYRSK